MTQKDLFQTATSSQRAFHASRGQSLVDPEVLKRRKKTLVTSGRGLLTLLNKKDPLGLFLKMCLTSPHWGGLTKSSLIWKLRITQRQRLIFQLSLERERPTKENVSGLFLEMWPTPRASEYKDCGPVGSKSHTHMKKKHYLCAAVKDPEQPRGMLNPEFVEYLMGFPIGWTE